MKLAGVDEAIVRHRQLVDRARRRRAEMEHRELPRIEIGMATCGLAAGAGATKEAFEEACAVNGLHFSINPVGCLGHCYAEPLVVIHNPGFPPICYHNVTPGKAKALVKAFLQEGDPLYEFVLGAMEENDLIPAVTDFPRFHLEKRVVMERCGVINPEAIDEYLAGGGYSGLLKAIQVSPDAVIEEIIQSGLRGRGGAGFPTGRKWRLARDAGGSHKFIICNADEGDPGAYMDRTLLESNPHQLLEGMVIAAYAIGADRGIVYVRAEYPLAVERMRTAIRQAVEYGLLGKGILGTDLDFECTLFEGSGAFVCGEETALIESLEGKRGMPRHRPPYPVQKGFRSLPTVINNVKTLSSIPHILKHGARWYSGIGSPASPGTAIFSVVGKVVHPGLVEIAMGTTLRTLIFDICGGVPNHRRFKAVQIGGPSGGCLPESFLDTPIDFDSLTKAGAMMGSGGIVVMDEDDCIVDVTRYFLDFTQKESCGKCTFCRIGTLHLLNGLHRMTRGEGRDTDMEMLRTLSEEIKEGSLCGLGKTAPNPVLTTLKYFPEEYEAHVAEKRCPSMRCRALTAFYIDLDLCARGCDACVGSCPVEAIFTTVSRKKAIDQAKCVKCGECVSACPPEYNAVLKVSPPQLAPVVERPKEE
ncbi:MAG: 4Fe-4S binding protein [Deltaproteobacteria bacterium]|nr:4Fe-4S binding protein [Deltaproteobacteria bacterium]